VFKTGAAHQARVSKVISVVRVDGPDRFLPRRGRARQQQFLRRLG